MNSDYDEFLIWLENGQQRGWVSKIHCVIHESLPLTDQEREIVDDDDGDGYDAICVPSVRVWLG